MMEELQISPGEKGNQILDKDIEGDQSQEIVIQGTKMEDTVIEVKAEREEEIMEQRETESTTMGGQVDPEATAGRPNV